MKALDLGEEYAEYTERTSIGIYEIFAISNPEKSFLPPILKQVPVTRCRDCVRHKVEVIGGKEIWRCPMFVYDLNPDFYCAEGVKHVHDKPNTDATDDS